MSRRPRKKPLSPADRSWRRTAAEWTRSIGAAVLLALLLRGMVAEAYVIPTGSMIPTLEVGDRIFVNKLAYGLKVPLVRATLIPGPDPARGEVVVFLDPARSGPPLVKRVVAVGGDTVELRHNVVHVNGRPLPHRPLPGPCTQLVSDLDREVTGLRFCQAFAEELGGVRYRVFQDSSRPARDMPLRRVPQGHLFVMGDNRDDSNDSRFIGPIPADDVLGRAIFIWFSSGEPDGVRWHRMFSAVHKR